MACRTQGRGCSQVARWRNRKGRLRDHHESSRQAGSIKEDRKEMVEEEGARQARSQVTADMEGARPEPTGFGVSIANAHDVCSSLWEAVS